MKSEKIHLFTQKIYSHRQYFNPLELFSIFFWYLAMFPGRVGFDTALVFRMMAEGRNTDWWTGTYFRILQVLTFNGTSVYLFSAVSILLLFASIKYICNVLIPNPKIRKRVSALIFVTPFFGVFGMTVAHDVLQVSGILLIIGASLEIRNSHYKFSNRNFYILMLGMILNLCVKSGIIYSLSLVLILLFKKVYRHGFYLLCVTVLLSAISLIGIDTSWTNQGKYVPLLADIKCVLQHPEARVDAEDWKYFASISTINAWKEPLTCSDISAIDKFLKTVSYSSIDSDSSLTKHYLRIVQNNPAIVLMAHIQRSSNALPPPFFRWPENQVDLNYSNPIGKDTNIALQKGPELLHPSVDYDPVRIGSKFLKPLNLIAQIPTFLINQASWFWGWGGLWLWPILFFWVFKLRVFKILDLVFTLLPVITLHLTIFALGISPTGRHVMITILLGLITSFAFLFDKIEKLRG